MASNFRKVGLPGEHRYTRGLEEEPLLYSSDGKQKLVQTRSARMCSGIWTLVIVTAFAAAIAALIVGAVALRNTNEGLIGRIANLIVGNFYATGNGVIDGSLVVGGGITSRKRADGEMAVDVNGPSRFLGEVSASSTLTVGDTAGRKRGTHAERGNSRGRTRAACKPEKLTVRGSASFCGGVQVNGTANLTDTNVNGTLTASRFEVTNKTRRVLYVGASREYKNISHALQQFTNLHAGDVRIFVDPGVYVDNIEIGSNFSSSVGLEETVANNRASRGLTIFGDSRPHVGLTYFNGMQLIYTPFIFDYQIVTSTGAIFGAASALYDTDQQVLNVQAVTVNDGVAPTQNGCETPFANAAAVAGKAVLIERGACGFLAKSQNAATNGAVVTILYQNSPAPPVQAAGGSPNTLPGLTVMISAADALILQGLIASNPGLTLSVVAKPTPAFGAVDGVVSFSHPSDNLSVLQINVTTTNPNFTSLNVVPGDKITVAVSGLPAVTYFTRTIVAVSNNVLTLDTPLGLPANSSYSGVTFLPNVQIMSKVSNAPTLLVTGGSGLYFDGIAFVSNPAFAFAEQLSAIWLRASATIVCSRSVVDLSLKTSNTPIYVALDATMIVLAYSPSDTPTFSLVGGRLFVTTGGYVEANNFYLSGSSTNAIVADYKARIGFASAQIVNANSDAAAANSALRIGFQSSVEVPRLIIANHGANSPLIGLASDSSFIARDVVLQPPLSTANVGISAIQNSRVFITSLAVTGTANGLIATDGATITVTGALALTNITTNQYIVNDKSVLSAQQSALFPLDIRTITAGPAVIDHAFETQILNGAGTPIAATLNAGATFATRPLYQGKRYYIRNQDGAQHTIQLAAGQRFDVAGALSGSNTLTFPATNNTVVQLFVQSSTRVAVEASPAGTTFALNAPTKKDVRDHESDHTEAMYEEYLASLRPPTIPAEPATE